MKALFVLHRVHPNLRGVRRAMSQHGIQCYFVVENLGPSEDPSEENSSIFSDGPTALQAREILNSFKPDLLIQRNFADGFAVFWQAARELGIPSIVYDQDPLLIPFADVFVRPLRVFRLFRDIIVRRLRIGRHHRVTPVKYWGSPHGPSFKNATYLPFPIVYAGQGEPRTPSLPRVITVAKHGQKRKRISWLIRVLEETRFPFTVDIVGSSPEAGDRHRISRDSALRSRVNRMGAKAVLVRFHNDLNEDQLLDLYRNCDLFVLPSKREMLAISPLEAMAAGLPVLISSDGGAVSYVMPGGREQIFRSRSFRSFQTSLNRLLSDRTLREKIKARNGALLRQEHSPEKFISRLLAAANLPL